MEDRWKSCQGILAGLLVLYLRGGTYVFSKRDLIEYLAAKVAYYVYDGTTPKPIGEEVKEMSLEAWADEDFLDYVLTSDKIKGRDILNDYYLRTKNYVAQAKTKEGKEVFLCALVNASRIEEDLEMEYGEEYYL